MTCTLNNTNQNGIFLYDGVPNIIRVEDNSSQGMGAVLNIRIPSLSPASGMTLTINGESVVSVINNPGPRRWVVGPDEVATASNIADALNQCPSIVGACNVGWGTNGYVNVRAYGAGEDISYESDIPGIEFEYTDPVSSSLPDTLNVVVGGVTLTKKVCSSVTCFDVSPVLSSIASFGQFVQDTIWVYARAADGAVTTIATYNVYVTHGYVLKGQEPYSVMNGVAQWLGAGKQRDVFNNTVLYVSEDDDILLSWRRTTAIRATARVQWLDSALNVLGTKRFFFDFVVGNNDMEIPTVDDQHYEGVKYISVSLGTENAIRYNVIPASSFDKRVRICWRNSMGGVSFADLTGEQTEKSDIESVYIRDEGSSYGYYTDEYRHDERLLYQDDDKTFTAQTHLIDEDGTWLYDDLARSLLAWIEEDGVKRMILVTGVEKVRSYDNVWRVKVTYKYSEL